MNKHLCFCNALVVMLTIAIAARFLLLRGFVSLPDPRSTSLQGKDPLLVFIQQEEPYFSRAKSGSSFAKNNSSLLPCIIFSCSPADYKSMVETQLNSTKVTQCDRMHFWGLTARRPKTIKETDSELIMVAPHWCRVAILLHHAKLMDDYNVLFYVDVDLIFDESNMLMRAHEYYSNNDTIISDSNNKDEVDLTSLIISSKDEYNRQVQRTCWFIILTGAVRKYRAMSGIDRRRHDQALQLINRWGAHWRDVRWQDQTVFNEQFRCGRDGVACIPSGSEPRPELNHCGSWLNHTNRIACMQGKPFRYL